MGAIAGAIFSELHLTADSVTPMLQAQAHRAPGAEIDQRNWRNFQMGCLGASVASNEKGTLWAAVDGCLNGQKALCDLLRQEGFRFGREPCCADVVLKAYEKWGADLVHHCEGHISIAIFDQQQQRLLLCRDRFGRKPLYWYHGRGTFLFSSELKGLLTSRLVPPQPDLPALATHLALGYFPMDLTPIAGVSKLLPGHTLEVYLDGHKRVRRYWSYGDIAAAESRPSTAEELEETLQAAVNLRSGASCFLSGGIGSTSVGFCLSRSSEEEAHAYTTVFDGQNSEDLQSVEELAGACRLALSTKHVDAHGLLDQLPRMVWHLDEPLASPSVVGTWKLAQSAQGASTVLSGMGCDELLGAHTGYVRGLDPRGLTRWLARLPRSMFTRLGFPLLEKIAPYTAARILRHSLTDETVVNYLHNNSLFTEEMLPHVAPDLSEYFDSDVFIQNYMQHSKAKSGLEAMLCFDVHTRMAGAYIHQLERLTAAFGLQWEAPFLDQSVVSLLARLPEEQKVSEQQTAVLLRDFLSRHLPADLVTRPKQRRQGFLYPWASEQRMQNVLRSLEYGSLVETGLISRRWLVRELNSSRPLPASFERLWSILILEVWFRLYVNAPLSSTAPTLELEELFGLKPIKL